jgi:hypothetical protein
VKKTKGFRIQKMSKPVLEKVSVKLLMTAKEKEMFDLYAEKSGIDKGTIATKALNLFIRGDNYFKDLMKKEKDKVEKKVEVKKPEVKPFIPFKK